MITQATATVPRVGALGVQMRPRNGAADRRGSGRQRHDAGVMWAVSAPLDDLNWAGVLPIPAKRV